MTETGSPTGSPTGPLTGPQAFAARILIQVARDQIAQAAGLTRDQLAAFETGQGHLDDAEQDRLRQALEADGAHLIAEDAAGGVGVRLKFNSRDVRAINRWEGEGGPTGDDDV